MVGARSALLPMDRAPQVNWLRVVLDLAFAFCYVAEGRALTDVVDLTSGRPPRGFGANQHIKSVVEAKFMAYRLVSKHPMTRIHGETSQASLQSIGN